MNDNHLPDDDVLQLVFGELEVERQAAVRKAVAEDAELAATARELEAAVVAVRAENVGHLSAQFNDRLRQRMSEVLDHAQPETARPTFVARSLTKWRWIMRSPVSRVAAAAIFVLAVTGVALWFPGGGTTPAFANFLQPILEAKTVKYKVTAEFTALPPQVKLLPAAMQQDLMKTTMEVMMLDATRTRMETERPDKSKQVQISDRGKGKKIILLPAEKRASVFSSAKDKTSDQGPLAGFRALLLDAQDKPGVKRERLGEKEIDGRQVVGVRITLPAGVLSVWGDPKTGLPSASNRPRQWCPI